ncbi:MAG: acyltransferase family protein [Cytophagales bacterium]|nr:acyltransferase family protein [Cytophagales bacterium]
MKTRVYFLDNLRTFLILLVVLLHAGLVYEPVLKNTWIVIDPDQASSIGLLRMYLDIFVMFIMFFISGYFIPYSTKNKRTWDFITSKLKRIILPWIIAVLTLIPAYKAIFLYSRGLPQEEWFSYFHFFERAQGHMGSFAEDPTQNWLWFLPVLFVFQISYLLFSRLNLLSLKISLRTGALITVILGVAYSMVISETGLRGWFHSAILHFQRERLLIYFMAFLFGALCNKLRVFESDEKNMTHYVIANVALTFSISVFTIVALNMFFNMTDPARNYFIVSEFVDKMVYYLTTLLSMMGILYISIHIFRFNFNKINAVMKYLNKSSYAVYIIHMIVMGMIALVLRHFQFPGGVKFVILTSMTYVISNAIAIAYYRWFQSNPFLKVGTFGMLVIALFGFIRSDGKVNANPRDQGISQYQNPLPSISIHEAAATGNLKAIKQHIAAGTNIDEREPTGGSSPLITAITFGKKEATLALLAAGADTNLKNTEGSTALHTAAFFCRTEIVKVLIEYGADKSIKNNAGFTAFDSVAAPFEDVKGIYDYFVKSLGPHGLKLDYERLKTTRPLIAKLLEH